MKTTNFFDLHYPDAVFRPYKDFKHVNLIVESNNSMFQNHHINQVVSICSWDLDKYKENVISEKYLKVNSLDELDGILYTIKYDVGYIKETRIGMISESEWAASIGIESPEEFFYRYKLEEDYDLVVKLYNYLKISPNLRSFNRDYCVFGEE